MFNWTKQDVALVNKELTNANFFNLKGVVFYKVEHNSTDAYHSAVDEFITPMGGAVFVHDHISVLKAFVDENPGSAADKMLELAEVDEDGRYLMICLTDQMFESKYDTERDFVIAHEMAHLQNGDHKSETNQIDNYQRDDDQEVLADRVASEILGTSIPAVSFLTKVIETFQVVLAKKPPVEVVERIEDLTVSINKRITSLEGALQ